MTLQKQRRPRGRPPGANFDNDKLVLAKLADARILNPFVSKRSIIVGHADDHDSTVKRISRQYNKQEAQLLQEAHERANRNAVRIRVHHMLGTGLPFGAINRLMMQFRDPPYMSAVQKMMDQHAKILAHSRRSFAPLHQRPTMTGLLEQMLELSSMKNTSDLVGRSLLGDLCRLLDAKRGL